MSKTKKYLKISLVFFLGVIFGGFTGGYIGFSFSKSLSSMRYLLASASLSEYSYHQYQNSTYEDGKKALLEFIKFCDEIEKQTRDEFVFGKDACLLDSGTAYARLAVLEKRQGNEANYANYMKQAQAKYRNAGWEKTSENHILQFISSID